MYIYIYIYIYIYEVQFGFKTGRGTTMPFSPSDSLKKNTWQKNNLDFEFMDRQFLGMLIGGL